MVIEESGSHSAVIHPENDAPAWGLTGSFDALITTMLPLTFWFKTGRVEKKRDKAVKNDALRLFVV